MTAYAIAHLRSVQMGPDGAAIIVDGVGADHRATDVLEIR